MAKIIRILIAAGVLIAFCVCPMLLTAGIPVNWTVDTFRIKPLVYDCYHGETLDLAAALTAYGDPIDLAGKTAHLYWATNETASAWWSTNATVASSASVTNILAATFSGAYDTGAATTYGFIGIDGENYRASFTLRFRRSPGFVPSVLPLPTASIDCATTTFTNPESSPFAVKGGSGGVTPSQVTNISSAVTSNIVTKSYVESLGIGGGGCDTNAVRALIAPATNAVLTAAKTDAAATYLPLDGSKAMTGTLQVNYATFTSDNNANKVYIGVTRGEEAVWVAPYGNDGKRICLADGDDDSATLTENLAKSTFPIVTNAYTKAQSDDRYATSNMVVAVVDDRADRAITSAVDTAMTEILGSNWRTTYGTGLAGIIAALVAALTFLKRGKFDASEIAADWSSSTTYAQGENVTYRGKFYTSKVANNLGHTPTDTTYWNVSSLFTSTNTSLVSTIDGELPYTRNSTATLKDRAFNALTLDGTSTWNLSTDLAAVTATKSGEPRDLLITVTASAAVTIAVTSGTIKGDTPTISAAGTWLFAFTEYASGVWYCRQISLA